MPELGFRAPTGPLEQAIKATGFGGCMLITNGFFVLKALTILYRLYVNPYIIGSSYIFQSSSGLSNPHTAYGTPKIGHKSHRFRGLYAHNQWIFCAKSHNHTL